MSFMKDREADLQEVVATPEGSVDSFSPEGQRAILAILITLGDNKYKLGRRYSEWATSGPTLEASVAAASMTSDEMGHARSLYPLLRRFPGAPPELRSESDRTEFQSVTFLDEPFAEWTDLIAAASLFDKALTTLIEALRNSAYSPFRHRAEKMLQEERYHRLYADGWLETLARNAGSCAAIKKSMNRIWLATLAWFGPEEDPVYRAATAEGVVAASGSELRERFVQDVRATVEPIAGIEFPSTQGIPWERFDPRRRSLAP